MTRQVGKYRVLKTLAAGGMAEIYLAKLRGPEGFEKLLVVKMVLPHLSKNSDFTRMFLDEARLAAQLSHPNIVQIFDFGVDPKTQAYYIAMEYIHGENLRTVSKEAVAKGQMMPVEYAAKVISQACEGLYYAHTKTDAVGKPLNVVHRDISPQNLLLSFDGLTKVVDFGIAKAATQVVETQAGVLKGKYAYMSPEQCRGNPLDGRSDLFALGICLWELLTNKGLFRQGSELAIMKAIVEDPVPPPSSIRPDVPPALDALVMKALAKKTKDRFQDCMEFHTALEEFLRDQKKMVSSVHLGAFMRGIFVEKLEQWQKIQEAAAQGDLESELFEEVGSEVVGNAFRAGSTTSQTGGGRLRGDSDPGRPGGTGRHQAQALRQAAGIASGPARGGDEAGTSAGSRPLDVGRMPTQLGRAPSTVPTLRSSVPPPPEPSSKAPMIAAAVAGVLLVVGGAAYLLRPREAPPPAVAAPTPPVKARLLVVSEPTGAQVFVNGTSRAFTPANVGELEPEVRHQLVVKLAGFQDFRADVMLKPGEELRYPVTLVKDPAQAPATPPVEAAATFVAVLETDPPGATVLIDGASRGRTPTTLADLPAGKALKLSFTLDGHDEESQTITGSGGQQQVVRVALKKRAAIGGRPGPKPKGGEKEPPRGSPTTAEPPPPPPPTVAAVAEKGKLRFNVTPWAHVWVNGEDLGVTPFPPKELPAGTYRVKLENSDLKQTKELTVTVKAGQTESVKVNLVGP